MVLKPLYQAAVSAHINYPPPTNSFPVASPMQKRHILRPTTPYVETIVVLACYTIEVMPCDVLWAMDICYSLVTQSG